MTCQADLGFTFWRCCAGILDRFDQPELLDDLIDGWVAEVHAEERLEFIHLLQHFATAKNVRVSILSGERWPGNTQIECLHTRTPGRRCWLDAGYLPR